MLNPEQKFTVFISSTFEDLKEERNAAMMAVLHMGHIPIGMELFGAVDMKVFEYIKRSIDNCDYYILIIGGRYGSLSEKGISYTQMEYEYAVEKKIPVTALIHEDIDNLHSSKREKDSARRAKLEEFIAKVRTNCHVGMWKYKSDITAKVSLGLSQNIELYPREGWRRISEYQVTQEKLKNREKLDKVFDNIQDPICFYNAIGDVYLDDEGYVVDDSFIISISLMEVLRILKYNLPTSLPETDIYEVFRRYIPKFEFENSMKDIKSELLDLEIITVFEYDEPLDYTERQKDTFWNLTKFGRQVVARLDDYLR